MHVQPDLRRQALVAARVRRNNTSKRWLMNRPHNTITGPKRRGPPKPAKSQKPKDFLIYPIQNLF